jgi:hypothetical protein
MKCTMRYKGDGLRFSVFACYSWEMALKSSSMYHSIIRRSGKEYGRKQEELMILPVEFLLYSVCSVIILEIRYLQLQSINIEVNKYS